MKYRTRIAAALCAAVALSPVAAQSAAAADDVKKTESCTLAGSQPWVTAYTFTWDDTAGKTAVLDRVSMKAKTPDLWGDWLWVSKRNADGSTSVVKYDLDLTYLGPIGGGWYGWTQNRNIGNARAASAQSHMIGFPGRNCRTKTEGPYS